jgi:S-adenosylmethionine hydrolase
MTEPSRPRPRPIALLTDFGLEDWYVAPMKGEILRRSPDARIVDISHGAPPQQIRSAAFLLACVAPSMPADTVFCCVVDPGFGSGRRSLCGRIGGWMFSGPDNGLLTPLLELAKGDAELFTIENPEFRNAVVSPTFHGRDLFAPAAARLAAGVPPSEAGPPADKPILLYDSPPEDRGEVLIARVMLIDHFGNLVTNLTREAIEPRMKDGAFEIRAGRLAVRKLAATFSEAEVGGAVAYWGSAGTLEIGINQGSAAQRSALPVGGSVEVAWKGCCGGIA